MYMILESLDTDFKGDTQISSVAVGNIILFIEHRKHNITLQWHNLIFRGPILTTEELAFHTFMADEA